LKGRRRYTEEEIARWFAEVLKGGAHNPKPKEIVVVSMKYKHGYVIKRYIGDNHEG